MRAFAAGQALSYTNWRLLIVLTLLSAAPITGSAQRLGVSVEALVQGADVTYGPIGAVLPLRAGRVAVAFPQERVVRLFSPTGALLSETGQRGSGPADFATLSAFGIHPAGFWVFDRNNARFALLTVGGKPNRVFPMPTAIRPLNPTGGEFNLLAVHGVGAGDTVLVRVQRRAPLAAGRYEAVFLMSPAGQLFQELMRIPADPCFQEATVEGQLASIRIPFCVGALFAVSPDGLRMATMKVEQVPSRRACLSRRVVGLPTANQETCWPISVRAVTDQERDSARAELIAKAPHPDLKRAAANLTGFPATHPPYRRMLMGDDGWVWLEAPPSLETRTWVLLDAVGKRVAEVVLPKGVELRAVSRMLAWGVRSAEDGTEDLVRVVVQ